SFYCLLSLRDLPSFPTRRSSDLGGDLRRDRGPAQLPVPSDRFGPHPCPRGIRRLPLRRPRACFAGTVHAAMPASIRAENPAFRRSEEHTSELQSRSDLVCRLLLE